MQGKCEQWYQKFKADCLADPSRFEKPIPRGKIKNFIYSAAKSKTSKQNMRLRELQGTRNLFGSLLYLSTKEKLDLAKVFEYPLTPVPLALGYSNGSIYSTAKSKLQNKLEDIVPSTRQTLDIEVILVDVGFYLYQFSNPPCTLW